MSKSSATSVGFAMRILPQYDKSSTSSLALVVAEEFIILATFTAITVEFRLYAFWAGILLGFFIHLLVHILMFIINRRYVPFVITSILSSIYCLIAIHDLNVYQPLAWPAVAEWTLAAVIIIGGNLRLAHALAAKFEGWLSTAFPERQ